MTEDEKLTNEEAIAMVAGRLHGYLGVVLPKPYRTAVLRSDNWLHGAFTKERAVDYAAFMRGRWHVKQTLIGCPDGEDINRRHLVCGLEEEFRVTFNERMVVWHPDDDKALHALCRYLNRGLPTIEEFRAMGEREP